MQIVICFIACFSLWQRLPVELQKFMCPFCCVKVFGGMIHLPGIAFRAPKGTMIPLHKRRGCSAAWNVHAKSFSCIRHCSLPGSSAHGILQARILAWVEILFPWGSSPPRNWTSISCLLHWQVGSLPLAPPGKPKMKASSPATQPHGLQRPPPHPGSFLPVSLRGNGADNSPKVLFSLSNHDLQGILRTWATVEQLDEKNLDPRVTT